MTTTPFTIKLGLNGSLIVAPMAGGPTTPELVAAASNAGALGTLAGAYLSPEELDAAVRKTRALTPRPFGINLFVPAPQPNLTEFQIRTALNATRPYRDELGLPDPVVAPPFHPDFEKQFSIVLESKPATFSFIFGLLDKSMIQACRKNNIFTIGTATTLEEGLALEESGVDGVIGQGFEAGAHRGMFSPDDPDPLISTFELTRQLVNYLKIPVIAAGGIMDGNGIAAAIALGAQAVQLGTAFLLTDEAGTSKTYREAIEGVLQKGPSTQLTKAFSGRYARGLENRFVNEMKLKQHTFLPFPAQNAFTRDIRNQATKAGNPDFLSLWAGRGVNLIRKMKAGELVRTLLQEASDSI